MPIPAVDKNNFDLSRVSIQAPKPSTPSLLFQTLGPDAPVIEPKTPVKPVAPPKPEPPTPVRHPVPVKPPFSDPGKFPTRNPECPIRRKG